MAPPWPELFATDAERRHTFDDAAAEYERLLRAYGDRDHDIVLLPKLTVQARADFVLSNAGRVFHTE
jgi:predicted ATPase